MVTTETERYILFTHPADFTADYFEELIDYLDSLIIEGKGEKPRIHDCRAIERFDFGTDLIQIQARNRQSKESGVPVFSIFVVDTMLQYGMTRAWQILRHMAAVEIYWELPIAIQAAENRY